MERKRYERAQHGLRRILHYLKEEDTFERKIEYRFGLVLHPELEQFLLYDYKPDRIIGAIKETDKVVIRYDPSSEWQDEITKFKMDDRKTVLVPSDSLNKYADLARRIIGNRCAREVESFESFLAGGQESTQELSEAVGTQTWTFPRPPTLTSPLELSGQLTEAQYEDITIEFNHPHDFDRERNVAGQIAYELYDAGVGLSGRMTFDQLLGHYNSYRRDLEMQARAESIMEAQYARMGTNNTDWAGVNTINTPAEPEFYLRPNDLATNIAIAASGTSVNVRDMMEYMQGFAEVDSGTAGVPDDL